MFVSVLLLVSFCVVFPCGVMRFVVLCLFVRVVLVLQELCCVVVVGVALLCCACVVLLVVS